MRIVWNEQKAETNWQKHGVRFPDAARVFLDRLNVPVQDRHVDGEERWQTTGYIDGLGLVMVAHTWEGEDENETFRIISARRLTRHEKRAYEGR